MAVKISKKAVKMQITAEDALLLQVMAMKVNREENAMDKKNMQRINGRRTFHSF